MFSKTGSLLFAAGLIVAPLAGAVAQQNNPAGNMGSNSSATGTPGTVDSNAAARSTSTYGTGGTGSTSNARPGGTGTTVVPGTMSSQANSATGTMEQKKGPSTTSDGGGGQDQSALTLARPPDQESLFRSAGIP